MSDDGRFKSFFTTLPGILTGLAALIVAVTGYLAFQAGRDSGDILTSGGDGALGTTSSTITPRSIRVTTNPSAPTTSSAPPADHPDPEALTTTPLPSSGGVVGLVTATASATRPNGTDACGKATNYQAANTIDLLRDTAWMTPGDGTGAVIEVVLSSPATVSQVGLIPGYDKLDPCSDEYRFPQLRRVRSVQWSFDDGSTHHQVLEDRPDYQTIDVQPPVTTKHIRLTILETLPPNVARLDYTPIAEIGVG